MIILQLYTICKTEKSFQLEKHDLASAIKRSRDRRSIFNTQVMFHVTTSIPRLGKFTVFAWDKVPTLKFIVNNDYKSLNLALHLVVVI